MNYTPESLDRLYAAIEEQAESDFLQALKREFPAMQEIERENIMNRWNKLKKKAEERMQSRGKV